VEPQKEKPEHCARNRGGSGEGDQALVGIIRGSNKIAALPHKTPTTWGGRRTQTRRLMFNPRGFLKNKKIKRKERAAHGSRSLGLCAGSSGGGQTTLKRESPNAKALDRETKAAQEMSLGVAKSFPTL